MPWAAKNPKIMKKGLSVIVKNKKQFKCIAQIIGKHNCYTDWLPQMKERETAIVLWANKETDFSEGSVGCAQRQRDVGIDTIELEDLREVIELKSKS